jgi:hypothetical protein
VRPVDVGNFEINGWQSAGGMLYLSQIHGVMVLARVGCASGGTCACLAKLWSVCLRGGGADGWREGGSMPRKGGSFWSARLYVSIASAVCWFGLWIYCRIGVGVSGSGVEGR